MASQVPAMKLFDSEVTFRPIRISADFVDGYQRIVDVKRRVFEAFCHHGPGELLPLHYKIEIVRLTVLQIPNWVDQQHSAQKIESRSFARNSDSIFDICAVGFRDVLIANITPIYRQGRSNRYQRVL